MHAGVYNGATLGTPICVVIPNKDQQSKDYTEMDVAYRPSHADATYDMKYGIRAVAGGGRSSARETIGRVAAGAIAKKLLHTVCGTEVGQPPACLACLPSLPVLLLAAVCCTCGPRCLMLLAVQVLAYVSGVQDVEAHVDPESFTLEQVESNPVRCPDPAAAELMYQGTHP